MEPQKRARQAEIDANLAFFVKQLPELKAQHAGEYALVRAKKIEGFYETALAAHGAGRERFEDGLFSIQKVADDPIDLGIFSHAVNTR